MSQGNRLVHELDDALLVELAQGADRDEIIKKISIAAQFIFDCKIRHGRDKVSAMLVYYTYKHHKGQHYKPQSRKLFFKDFNKYFKPHRDKDGLYYELDPKSFDMSEETYWKMRSEWRKQKQRANK